MRVRAPLLVAGAGVFVVGVYGGALFFGGRKVPGDNATSKCAAWFEDCDNARKYDTELTKTEARINMPRLRAKLVSCVPPRAHVLEVACGSGFNIEAYAQVSTTNNVEKTGSNVPSLRLTSLTLTDSSDAMLELARNKAERWILRSADALSSSSQAERAEQAEQAEQAERAEQAEQAEQAEHTEVAKSAEQPEPVRKDNENGDGRFELHRAQDQKHRQAAQPGQEQRRTDDRRIEVITRRVSVHELAAAFSPNSFDCVVDTFGLCSFDDPREALEQMCEVLKPGGSLLLLEHGRASGARHSWLARAVNFWLDRHADEHAARWGCQWNKHVRDIVLQLVRDHNDSLEVLAFEAHHLGTTYMFVLRKK
ncbi:Methyltransferase OMS1, mitochondrial [Porphyridium purpureum]|uniref:Methyltransferase OMS1, mitochondrial n=1 Tax=Porphyridium purpureum TaxID=35688 RepID=A0A5J4YUW8_PORPP|nr:Methyltransferase OMS1, mitochondrial [Porphyridium purpureum]|eukprot:POR5251..scf227_4